MHEFIQRKIENFVKENLKLFPAVAILGSHQYGKSMLIKKMSADLPNFLYLDLQNRDDLAKLNEPSLFFNANKDKTICFDKIQLIPNLFTILRSEIDSNETSNLWRENFIRTYTERNIPQLGFQIPAN